MRTILLLDPDPARRFAHARALGDDDEVLALDTLEAARDALVALTPDLVVSATSLPDGAGEDLCRFVRALHGNKVPVLLLARAGVEPMGALLAGADDVITEPVAVEGLRLRCARLLRQSRRAVEV